MRWLHELLIVIDYNPMALVMLGLIVAFAVAVLA